VIDEGHIRWYSWLLLVVCLLLGVATVAAYPVERAGFAPQLLVEGAFLLIAVVGLLLLPRLAVTPASTGFSRSERIFVPLLIGFGGYAMRGVTDVLDELLAVPAWHLSVFKDGSLVVGSLAFVLGIYRWADERRQREQMLQARSAELEQQNRRLETFAAAVSHDLRNPLNVARGYAETLDDESGAAGEIRSSLDRMETIIEDVLELSRLGADAIDPEPVSLAAVARDAWDEVESGEATISLPSEDASVVADGSHLQQLFENLFRNALEHGTEPEPGGDPLAVSVGLTEDGFYVADDGRGIPVEERGAVLSQGYTTNESGTGLGLSIVSEIAAVHGWSVSVAEGPDGGARFEFAGCETTSGD
jgi:signal transduction histidine kinase